MKVNSGKISELILLTSCLETLMMIHPPRLQHSFSLHVNFLFLLIYFTRVYFWFLRSYIATNLLSNIYLWLHLLHFQLYFPYFCFQKLILDYITGLIFVIWIYKIELLVFNYKKVIWKIVLQKYYCRG